MFTGRSFADGHPQFDVVLVVNAAFKSLDTLARLFAVLAGVLLTLITLMTCVSLIGRNTTGWTIVGDIELSASAAGAAIALFLPWCQLRRGHITVDFFTARASAATQRRLDRLGALLLAGVMALMTWRTTVGGLNAWHSQAGSMILGFPDWVVYCGMVPPMLLTTLIALAQAFQRGGAGGSGGAGDGRGNERGNGRGNGRDDGRGDGGWP